MSTKSCDYCGKSIEIKKDGATWKPFNVDGTKHWCDRNAKPVGSNSPVTVIKLPSLEDLIRRIVRDELAKMKAI